MVEIDQFLQRVLHWDKFSALPNSDINSTTPSTQSHAVFNSFLSDNKKQYAANITVHSKRLISLLKEKKVMTTSLSTILENTDACSEQ